MSRVPHDDVTRRARDLLARCVHSDATRDEVAEFLASLDPLEARDRTTEVLLDALGDAVIRYGAA